jgi:uncharacterized membrane protein YfcA
MPDNTSAILLVTLCLGVILGLVGTGGALLIPALIFIFGLEQRNAQGTALLISALPVAFIPFLPYFRLGHYDLRIALLSAAGLAVGGYVGSELAQEIPVRYLRYAPGLVLIAGALRMFYGESSAIR